MRFFVTTRDEQGRLTEREVSAAEFAEAAGVFACRTEEDAEERESKVHFERAIPSPRETR